MKRTKNKPEPRSAVIRRLRTDRGWSQSKLARAANVSNETINTLENDDEHAPLDMTLDAIARALGVTVETLRGGAQ